MLLNIGTQRTTGESTIEQSLRECHDRIRHFSALAVRLCGGSEAPAEQRREAAQSLVRYFGEALPLHSADEDDSIFPRMIANADRELAHALETMRSDHVEIHQLLDSLMPAWRSMARDAQNLRAERLTVLGLSERLAATFVRHMELEERVIFPRIAALPSAEHQQIRDEMRARRDGPKQPLN